MIQLFLDKGANMDCRLETVIQPLMAAVDYVAPQYPDEEIVAVLLRRRAKINIADNDGITALMYACKGDSSNIIEQLLNKGADINLQDKKGKTALSYAVTENFVFKSKSDIQKILSLLLKRCANPNIADKEGNTPLIYACRQGNIPMVRLLLAYNANMLLKNKNGDDVSALARKAGNKELQEVLWLHGQWGNTFEGRCLIYGNL